jgi:uncharacterized protein with von Willebrand factor type A (vWA) domain
MERKLIDFIRVLRNADVRISTSESIDAMRAMALVGYEDRMLLKNALGSALAKTQEEKESFDYCFEHFFSFADSSNDETSSEESDDHASAGEASEQAGNEAATTQSGGDLGDSGQDSLASLLQNSNSANGSAAIDAAIVQAGDAVDLKNIQIFTQKGQFSRRMMMEMGLAELQDTIHELEQSENSTDHQLASQLKQQLAQLQERVRNYVEEQYLLFAGNSGKQLREDVIRKAKLSNLDAIYYRDMQGLIRKMAKKLASQHARRKKIYKRGQLDAGKTIRYNVANDGILFDTYWKSKRKDRPKVMVLCDVSGSVALYSRFLLMLLYSLHDVLPDVRAFAFSSQLGEVSDVLKNYQLEQAMEIVNAEWGMGSSDYGSSLEDFCDLCLDDINQHSTIIILGDGRNNNGDPKGDLLKQIYDRCQRLLWINPESKPLWGSGDSEMPLYSVYCHEAAECNTLNQLERIISRLLRVTLK